MCAAVFFSCSRPSGELPLNPPPTNPLSRTFVGYAVVSASYTRVLSAPTGEGISRGYLRRGSVVRVLERRAPRASGESWVMVDGASRGWLPEGVIQIYDSEERAMTAAESMTR